MPSKDATLADFWCVDTEVPDNHTCVGSVRLNVQGDLKADPGGSITAIEYLLVTFPEQRNVFADGAGVGVTNHILMLPGDEYQITLDGGGYAPESLDVPLNGTSLVRPLVVAFAATGAVGMAAPMLAGSAPALVAASATPAAPIAAKSARRTAATAPAKTASRDKKNA